MRSPAEHALYRWTWVALVAGGMFLLAHMTRYQHLAFSSDLVGPGSSQHQLTETVWDRWNHEVCHLVRGVETGPDSRDYSRRVCWSHEVFIPSPRRVSSTRPAPPPRKDLIREYDSIRRLTPPPHRDLIREYLAR